MAATRRSMSLYTNPLPCKHLAEYKLKYRLTGFESLQKWLKTSLNGRTSLDNSETKIPRCMSCNGYQGRFYLCLVCSSISCSSHTCLHAQFEKAHDIGVDVERLELYCYSCSDQVYDPDFDKIVMSSKNVQGILTNAQKAEDVTRRSSKRRRLSSDFDVDLKKYRQMVTMKDQREKSCYPPGLRGLNNLGSTCFMNSVLQVLIHAAPFRNYFLGKRHDREACSVSSSNEDEVCLVCNVDEVLSAAFSGDRMPYSPAQFLYSCWKHSTNLASYEQQDAHEFFISLLDWIHQKEEKERNSDQDSGDCQCIAHRVFSGLLRSNVTCMTCGSTSTTYDPCMDISLDLDKRNVSSGDGANKSREKDSTSVSTLSGCLDLFTRPEKLEADQKFHCAKCNEKRDSLKQMSITRLPLVLGLHIKRFEQSLEGGLRKLNWHLHFPFSLDMSLYTSSSIIRSRYGNRIFAFESDEGNASPEFEVLAVITHSGELESGHYITYVRLKNQWYKCDDPWITVVDEAVVRASQCYMIFYVQKFFYQKANDNLS